MATQVIDLGNGDNTITPTPPDDDYIITGGDGNNTVTLGNGTNQFTLGNGSNTLTVGNGPNQFTLGGGNNTVTAGNGNSNIIVGAGDNTITVGTGSNTIALGAGLNTVQTGAGNNVVTVSGATLNGNTIQGALTSGDGSTNQLVLTTPGTMNPVNVSGFGSYQLANGGPNSLTLAETNFERLPGGSITVIGGNSGDTIDASSLSAEHAVTVFAGAGNDVLTGGAGNDVFVFAPGNTSGDTVDGGAGNNTLNLAAGGAGTLEGLGTDFVNIDTVFLDTNADWTIEISDPAVFTGTISGSDSDDTFDLANVPFDSGGSADLLSGNLLQITENGSTFTIQLDPLQDFTGSFFHLASDGDGSTLVTQDNTPCFCRGTLIGTEAGEVPVEELAIGDKVVTLSGAARPIKWIGTRAYDPRFIAGNHKVLPIRIEAGALAHGVPARDLWVSPEHALYIRSVLVPAHLLVNGATITQVESVSRLEYFHIELGTHDVIQADGAPVETFVDCANRFMFQNRGEFAALYPDDTAAPWQFCAPRLEGDSAELTTIRRGVLARVELFGRFTGDSDLHLLVDGAIVRPQLVANNRVYCFAVPAGTRSVALESRSNVPAQVERSPADGRCLGVAVERIVLRGASLSVDIRHDFHALSDGFHEAEASHRWTDGRGRLPEGLLASFGGGFVMEVHLAETEMRYGLDTPATTARVNSPRSASPIPTSTRRMLRRAS